MNNQITIIIPTYNRPSEIARLLHFLADMGSQYRVLVLDGSNDDVAEKNRVVIDAFPLVEHYRFESSLHLGMRLHKGLELVKTPYVLMCGDDDFFFPDAADRCADFLDSHSDYAAAIGQVWSLRYYPQKLGISNGIALGNDLDVGSRFDHVRFIQRAMFYFAYTAVGSIPLFYAVRRTESTRKAFSFMTPDIKYSSMELLTNGLLLIDGKVAKLATPFGLRDYGSVTTRDPEREGATRYIPHEDIAYIRPLLVDALMRKEALEAGYAEYTVDSLLQLWEVDAIPMEVSTESSWRSRMRSGQYYFLCLAGILAPTWLSGVLGMPPATYRAILGAHQRFTARRSST
ncbi:hypothetical protein hmeg3_21235 [Herbaspirillum sp. meg3]|uniref:TIGR00180 family glycosyltransferase n=1 Tax=Herbaspirillum sp. meg3 TaxID=2025949 RepID=UPI000B996F4A|nr:TIGR00180 family glycosyltransferase [Herbaspirillum sp. meg3]ASU40573.1 hypothetical protein hmeg3_21235 [Herbaspirillum sp. meg3]